MARPIRTTVEALQPANHAALRLDIRLCDARYDLQSRSKDAKRLTALIEQTRDLRNAIEEFQNEVAER